LRFASGSARGVDLDGEGAELRIDAILDGRWDASVDVGQGPRAVEAVFLGHR